MSGAGPHAAGEERAHYAARQAAGLDATAPSLGEGDGRRIDRRALVLLALVVLLLLLAIVAMLRMGGTERVPAGPREEVLVVPEPPRLAATAGTMPVPPPDTVAPPAPVPVPVVPLPRVQSSTPALLPVPASPAVPGLVERRAGSGPATGADPYMQAMLSGLPGSGEPRALPAPATPGTAARPLSRADSLLVRGTFIRCVLETRIVTDVPGQASCVVTEPVYSVNGRRLLLPAGSKVAGHYDGGPRGERVAVVWDRIVTPTGIDVSMASPGADGLGGAGHPGRYSAHWGSRIGSALLVSLIGDAFKYAAAKEGPSGTVIGEGGVVVRSPYESATARSLERLAHQALDVRRPPTVTLLQGTVVNIHVARDVDFSAVMESP